MSDIFALVIDPTIDDDSPDIRSISGYDALREIVGGPIEAVFGYRNRDEDISHIARIAFYLNEEGKLLGLAPNPVATALWDHYHPGVADYDVLCGPVVVVGACASGEDLTVPEDVIDAYSAIAYLHTILPA